RPNNAAQAQDGADHLHNSEPSADYEGGRPVFAIFLSIRNIKEQSIPCAEQRQNRVKSASSFPRDRPRLDKKWNPNHSRGDRDPDEGRLEVRDLFQTSG